VVGFQADVEKFRRTNETGTKLFKMEEIVTPTYRHPETFEEFRT